MISEGDPGLYYDWEKKLCYVDTIFNKINVFISNISHFNPLFFFFSLGITLEKHFSNHTILLPNRYLINELAMKVDQENDS